MQSVGSETSHAARADVKDVSLSPAVRLPAEVKTPSNGTKKIVLRVTGMTCSSCVANIERHLSKCDGELLCKNFLCSFIFKLLHNTFV